MAEREAVSRLRLAVLTRARRTPSGPARRCLAVCARSHGRGSVVRSGARGGRAPASARRPNQGSARPLRACLPHLRNRTRRSAFRGAGRGPPGAANGHRRAHHRRAVTRPPTRQTEPVLPQPSYTRRPRCRACRDRALLQTNGARTDLGRPAGDGRAGIGKSHLLDMHRRRMIVRRRLRLERPRLRTRSGHAPMVSGSTFCERWPRAPASRRLPPDPRHAASRSRRDGRAGRSEPPFRCRG